MPPDQPQPSGENHLRQPAPPQPSDPGTQAGQPGSAQPPADPPAPDLGAPAPDGPPPDDGGDPPGGQPDGITPDSTEQPGSGKPGPNERIQELVAQREAAKEFAEYWRQIAIAGGKPAAATPPQPAAQQQLVRPKRADYEDDDAYQQAVDDYTDARIDQGIETRAQKQQRDAEAARRRATWNERCQEYAKDHADFYQTIGSDKLAFTDLMADIVEGSEMGPAVAHHLGKNPTEAVRIARMGAQQQAHAMGVLEARIKAELTASAAQQPGATPPAPPPPPPPNPVAAAGSQGLDLETCSTDDYIRHRVPGFKPKR